MSEKEDLEKLKNELVGMIAHKVRTSLAVMKEGLSLVLDEVLGKLTQLRQFKKQVCLFISTYAN